METNKPAYLALYESLREEILSGVRPFGSRLPSRRLLARDRGVSTVTADYVPEQPAWSHSAPEPAAQAVFTVTESDGIRQITSLHFAEDAETDPTAETTTE